MRIRDEEKMCLEIMTGAWRLAADAAFHMDRTKQA